MAPVEQSVILEKDVSYRLGPGDPHRVGKIREAIAISHIRHRSSPSPGTPERPRDNRTEVTLDQRKRQVGDKALAIHAVPHLKAEDRRGARLCVCVRERSGVLCRNPDSSSNPKP